jgi:hypothetical protein
MNGKYILAGTSNGKIIVLEEGSSRNDIRVTATYEFKDSEGNLMLKGDIYDI